MTRLDLATDHCDALTPSQKLTLLIIRESPVPLTQQQIATRTTLPSRTVQHALQTLRDRDLVERQTHFADGRRYRYDATGDTPQIGPE